jgi:hypothetical protein
VRVWASLGTPCSGLFLPVALLREPAGAGGTVRAVVPGILGDAAAWRSFAALSRRVETPGDEGRSALAAIRDALGPLEAEVWADAQVLWDAGSGVDTWETAAARWDAQARSILAALADPA